MTKVRPPRERKAGRARRGGGGYSEGKGGRRLYFLLSLKGIRPNARERVSTLSKLRLGEKKEILAAMAIDAEARSDQRHATIRRLDSGKEETPLPYESLRSRRERGKTDCTLSPKEEEDQARLARA